MGCWNQTCGLTNLPILHGDEVVFIPLVRTLDNDGIVSGYVRSAEVWHPLALPIRCKYDDYGGVEEVVEDASNHILQSRMTKWISEKTVSANKDAINDSRSFLRPTVELMSRGNFSINLRHWQGKIVKSEVVFMLVHAGAYAKAVTHCKQTPGVFWDHSADLSKQGEQFLQQMRETLKLLQAIEGKLIDVLPKNIDTGTLLINSNSYFSRFYANQSSDPVTENLRWVTDELANLVQANDSRAEELVKAMVDFQCFTIFIECARKLWSPQSGQGSQSTYYDFHQMLSEFVVEHIAKVGKELDY